jgi:general secretion pathway protein L
VSEYLVIRLGVRATDPVHWLVWSQSEREIIASGRLHDAAELSQLKERAGGRPIIGLVPSSEVLFREVTLPGKLTRQSLKALPYLLEEEVASDVESLHLVVLGSQGKLVSLLAVDHKRMTQWLGWMEAAGLSLKQLLPDVLALPRAEEGWSAVLLGEQWLFRQSEYAGMQVEAEWLGVLLAGYDPAPRISSYSAPPLAVPGEWLAEPAELPMSLLAQGATAARGNLLVGNYRIQPEWQRLWQPWRKVALIAGVLLTLLLTNRVLYLYEVRSETAQLRTQSVQLYKQLFPGENKVINPKSQMQQHLKALGDEGQQQGFIRLLLKLVPVFTQASGLKIEQLRFDQKQSEFRLQATGNGYQDFDRFRQLTESDFSVKPGDMKSEGGKVQGTLILRSKS